MANDNLWMPLCVADYLADTTRLTTIQHGAYLLLLMDYWRNGPLPDDATQLMMIARSDRKTWARDIWPVVGAFFRLGADGRLHQKRADQELARASDITEKRRAAAQSRWRGNGRDEPPPSKDASAYANASPNEYANVGAKPQQTPSNSDAKSMHSRARATHYTTQQESPPVAPPPGGPRAERDVLGRRKMRREPKFHNGARALPSEPLPGEPVSNVIPAYFGGTTIDGEAEAIGEQFGVTLDNLRRGLTSDGR